MYFFQFQTVYIECYLYLCYLNTYASRIIFVSLERMKYLTNKEALFCCKARIDEAVEHETTRRGNHEKQSSGFEPGVSVTLVITGH